MIILDVEDYCHDNCQAFEPDVDNSTLHYMDMSIFKSDTTIRCKRRNLCKQLLRYLERQLSKKEATNDGD